jgi:two-component system NtrC family sensor kinase
MQSDHGKKSMQIRAPGRTGPFFSRPFIVAVLFFLVAIAVATALISRLEQYRYQEERARVANLASDHVNNLQHQLNHAFSATYALAALVRQGHGTIADFDDVAYQMLPFYPGVAALQLAPDGVTRQIYPLAGNEKGIGHDLLKNPNRNKEAILARDTGKLTLAGPFELVQGGVGAVARLPVFLDGSQGKPAFWGFTNVLIRFPQVLDQARLSQLTDRGFAYELWRIHPDSGEKQVIAASSSALLNEPVEQLLSLPNGTWTLSMVPVTGWGDPVGLASQAALGLLFSLLLAWLAKLLVESKEHEAGLEALVAERTEDLKKSAKALREELDARRLAEESLQRQKRFTENLIENSAAATFVLDPQHKIVLWNKACEELTGMTATVMVGTDQHWQAFYDHERPCLADIVLDAGSDRLPALYSSFTKSTLVADGLHAEGWYKNLHGQRRYIMFDAAPVYDSSGDLLAAIETIQDITEQKRAEEALQENTARMSVILDGINALIYVADLETHEILFVNKYGRDIWGEIAGKICWETLQTGQDGPCAFCTNDRLLTADGVPTGVYAWEFQNTVTGKWYDCRDQAIRWSDGRLVRMEIATDISDRKKAEGELRLQSALQSAANAIVITDRSGAIEWVNPAFSALSGYGAEEVIGSNPRELLKSGVHEPALYKELWDTLLAGEVWRGEMMNRHKDGTLYPEGQTITPVKDANGAITHFIAIKRDLTENHKLEAQLQHAQKMESIGTLAGGIAHDLNNILTATIGYGTLALMKMAADDPHRLYVQHMLDASDRAAHLTKDLLLFGRKQAIHRKPANINIVVAKVETFLNRVIGEDITYKTILHAAPIPVLADEYQLEQVLMNLATNARDAMPHGGTLTVTTGTTVLDAQFISSHGFGQVGPYALITVTDSGMGMDAATQQRIFEPFFTTKEVGKGTGLGLAVTYGIIKQHDGYINVYSEPGTGTTFRIYLPLIEAATDAEDRPAEQEVASVSGTETILLAEDDEHVRNLTRSVLSEFGYTVIAAVDGADAVKKFSEDNATIDLLLFDLIMPKMNGKEAFDAIRKIRPGIKVIFTSGYAPETIQGKTSLADGTHLIAKPANPTALLRKVRSVLDE